MTSKEQALDALEALRGYIEGIEAPPAPPVDPKPVEAGPTRAQIIDKYFREKNYYPQVPYVPIGDLIVDICENHTGDKPLWVSTMAAACEQEGGGKNVLGCDAGAIECNKPVTRAAILRLIAHYQKTKISNGVGPMQITWFPFIQKAENMGGAHILRNSMTVGAQHLNDLLNRYHYLNALEMYNDGREALDPSNPYEVKFAAKHVEWRKRLAAAVDDKEPRPKPGVKPTPPTRPTTPPEDKPSWDPASPNGKLSPPGFIPRAPRSGNYTDRYPTRFTWREDIEQVVRDLYKEFGKHRIFVNTYVDHPPAASPSRPNVSLDVWGGGGDKPGHRGLWLPADIGAQVWDYLWSDKTPRIRWGIYHRKIYGVWNNYNPEPFGNGTVFENHDDHIHCTFDGPFERIR
jgi:hypothetical protein